MDAHAVSVTPAGELRFAARFNAAAAFVDRHLRDGRGERLAIVSEEQQVTYRQLAERVARCGHGLRRLGLEPGDRLLMIVADRPVFFDLFWGAIKAGVVPVPVNTLLRAEDFRYMIDDSTARAVVFSAAYAGEVESALAAAKPPAHVLRAEEIGERFAQERPVLEPLSTRAEDDCFWLYSSGSTGRPKAAVHAHRDLAVTAQRYGVETLGMGSGDVFFSAAKLFFAYGLGNAMSFPLWVGGRAVLAPERPTPELTFRIIERFRPTLYFGVPTLYAAQLEALETAQPDLSSLRLCVSAGEALPADLLRRWRERTGLDILDGIGSTEALHIFISNRPGDVRPGTSGRPVPGYEARIVDARGRDLPPGEPGRLLIRGGSIASRYWNHPEKTAATMRPDGWLDTGDVYVRDADGYYTCCGRGDDMIKVGGIWCSPLEIEARLIEHPAVVEAAVVGLPDAHGLIKPEAFVVLADSTRAGDDLAAELLAWCKAALAPYKYPRRFHWCDDLPKTATGKIQRFKLRQSA
ncbi:MAG: benzoate-CoA ligase family protein [Acidobacteria bacterium]|nr:MAG: benzoate-CoA ligase family protein [Acidobacteriota bacterium]